MLKLHYLDCSDAFMLVSGTKKIANTEDVAAPYSRKNIVIKVCASFADSLSEISNIHVIVHFLLIIIAFRLNFYKKRTTQKTMT